MKTTGFKRARIAIHCPGPEFQGERATVSAMVYGGLAVHHPVDCGGYNVTHVPTGLAIATNLSSSREAKLVASGLARADHPPFGDRFGVDVTKGWTSEQQEQGRAIIRSIRQRVAKLTKQEMTP